MGAGGERERERDLSVVSLNLASEAEVDPWVDELASLHDKSKDRDRSRKEIRQKRPRRFVEERTQVLQTLHSLSVAGGREMEEQ
jgi:hypothetical protein